jgi:hypothetical protein
VTAAHRAGRDTYIEGLRRVHAYGPSFEAYWEHEVAAVLSAGRRPPVVAGFGTYLRSDTIDRVATDFLEHQLEERTDRYDSHPSLSERLEALQACPPGDPDSSAPALSILREPDALEQDLLAALIQPEAADLPVLAWDDVGAEVYLARARALREQHGEALLVTLADAGWTVDAQLAEPVIACRGDEQLGPYETVAQLREDGTAAAGWPQRASALGIAELPLRAEAKVPA